MSTAVERMPAVEEPPPRRPTPVADRQETEPWHLPSTEVAAAFDVGIEDGLNPEQVSARAQRYGQNVLRQTQSITVLQIAARQLRSVVLWLLIGAAVASALVGDGLEAAAVAIAVTLTFVLGFATELRAVRSMEALKKLGSSETRVRRDGVTKNVPATHLVPGDIVVLEAGDRVSADLRIAEAAQLKADESVLTGESIPCSKTIESLAPTTALADRRNMLFKGTSVARGSGVGIVVGIGMDTELGRIASLTTATDNEETPLELELARLGRILLWACLGVAFVTAAIGVASGRDLGMMLTMAIALAVAAVPEGLPVVATIALARGMWRLAARHALIKRLSAVETLGATNLILVDKTGTLTENRLTAVTFVANGLRVDAGASPSKPLLELGALCNNAALHEGDASGDPLEVALLRAAQPAGIEQAALMREWPRVREVAFDPDLKMMATVHSVGEEFRIAVKGATEAVLASSTMIVNETGEDLLSAKERTKVSEMASMLAGEGLRVLAVAEKRVGNADASTYEALTLIGLIGFADPPRSDVREPLAACRRAGIRVVMATGDHAATAASIARSVEMVGDDPHVVTGDSLPKLSDDELLSVDIFARVAPSEKLAIVERHQQDGKVVAMTGDGVNDAPALRKAQIGVAMGKRGTDVARDAADMVLVDDSFDSIVAAIEQGRAIFANIRRFVIYLLSCNLSEVFIVAGAVAFGAQLPLLPLQILFLNLVTDVFPALALGFGRGSQASMSRPPRDPSEPIIARGHWLSIIGFAVTITIATLVAMWLAVRSGFSPEQATTVSFLTLGFAQLWHVFNLRDRESPVLRNDVVRNPWVWGAIAVCVGLLVCAMTWSPVSRALSVAAIGREGWMIVLSMSVVPVLVGQAALIARNFLSTRTRAERTQNVE